MVRKIPTRDTNAGEMQLQAMAERLQTQGELRNPIIEQALMKAAREQSQAAVETTEQAAGLTGAAQVGMTALAQLQALGQASMQAQAQRVERMRATTELQASLRGQVAQLEEQRYQTNLQHQQFMEQLRMQEEQQKGNMLANVAGGALAAFAGGPGAGALVKGLLGGGDDPTEAVSEMFAPTTGQVDMISGFAEQAKGALTSGASRLQDIFAYNRAQRALGPPPPSDPRGIPTSPTSGMGLMDYLMFQSRRGPQI